MSAVLSPKRTQSVVIPCLICAVHVPYNSTMSSARSNQEYVLYGRGEGLVDSPRRPETGVIPPILPHRSSARSCSPCGAHRGAHRGYIGLSVCAVVPCIGGGRYGA